MLPFTHVHDMAPGGGAHGRLALSFVVACSAVCNGSWLLALSADRVHVELRFGHDFRDLRLFFQIPALGIPFAIHVCFFFPSPMSDFLVSFGSPGLAETDPA